VYTPAGAPPAGMAAPRAVKRCREGPALPRRRVAARRRRRASCTARPTPTTRARQLRPGDPGVQGSTSSTTRAPTSRTTRSTGSASASTRSSASAESIEGVGRADARVPVVDKLPDARLKKGLATRARAQARGHRRVPGRGRALIPTPRPGKKGAGEARTVAERSDRARHRSAPPWRRRGGAVAAPPTPNRETEGDMASVNKVIIVGNVGRDPGDPLHQGGDPIANFSIATKRSLDRQERPEAGAHRVAQHRGVRQDRPGGEGVGHQGPPGVRRGHAPDERVQGQGRQPEEERRVRVSGPNSRLVLLGGRGEGGSGGGGGSTAAAAEEAPPPAAARHLPTTSRRPTTTFRSS
jgi:single-strand DNA-binding protein